MIEYVVFVACRPCHCLSIKVATYSTWLSQNYLPLAPPAFETLAAFLLEAAEFAPATPAPRPKPP